MTTVRIYQQIKSAMQSGKKHTHMWCVDFESQDPLHPEFLMGWIPSQDMNRELRLSFLSLNEALHFAKRKGFQYTICSPTPISFLPKSYETNFTCPRIRGYVSLAGSFRKRERR